MLQSEASEYGSVKKMQVPMFKKLSIIIPAFNEVDKRKAVEV